MFTRDELEELTNRYSDLEIAKQYNVSRSKVQALRSRLDVQSYLSKLENRINADELETLASQYEDSEIANKLGLTLSVIKKARLRLGITPFKTRVRANKSQCTKQELDKLTDNFTNIEIAGMWGKSREYITGLCNKLGVKTFTEKTGNVKTASGEIIPKESQVSNVHKIPSDARRGKSQPKVRKHYFNEHYFSCIDTEDKAYFLGLLIADGCVYKTTVCLSLTDEHPIQEILKYADADLNLLDTRPNHDGGKTQYRVRFNSIQMAQDLLQLGVTPHKSFSVAYPQIHKDLERHLIRGLWDGDGHVSKSQAYLVGSEQCMTGVKNALNQHGLITANKISPNHSCFRLRLLKSRPETLLWIYSNCTVYLPRKHDVVHQFWS